VLELYIEGIRNIGFVIPFIAHGAETAKKKSPGKDRRLEGFFHGSKSW
jgi:hypothetical protein